MSEIKVIVFDLGKVIFDLSFDRVFQSWAVSSGKNVDDIKSKFIFDDTFDKFEKNEISPEQFRSLVSQRLEINISEQDFDKGWCDLYLDVYNGIDELLIELKRKYRIVALTNTNVIHEKVWRVKYAGTLEHFEKIFSSPDFGMRKPESVIYQLVLDHLNVQSNETLFLDDNVENINAANEIGIMTIHVQSTEQMKHDLLYHLHTNFRKN